MPEGVWPSEYCSGGGNVPPGVGGGWGTWNCGIIMTDGIPPGIAKDFLEPANDWESEMYPPLYSPEIVKNWNFRQFFTLKKNF